MYIGEISLLQGQETIRFIPQNSNFGGAVNGELGAFIMTDADCRNNYPDMLPFESCAFVSASESTCNLQGGLIMTAEGELVGIQSRRESQACVDGWVVFTAAGSAIEWMSNGGGCLGLRDGASGLNPESCTLLERSEGKPIPEFTGVGSTCEASRSCISNVDINGGVESYTLSFRKVSNVGNEKNIFLDIESSDDLRTLDVVVDIAGQRYNVFDSYDCFESNSGTSQRFEGYLVAESNANSLELGAQCAVYDDDSCVALANSPGVTQLNNNNRDSGDFTFEFRYAFSVYCSDC